MPSIIVEVAPEILDWAMQYASETAYTDLKKWKDGEEKPTFKKLQKVSRELHIPFGYFFLNEPPKENFPIMQYRTMGSLTNNKPLSRELIDTLNDMEAIQEWMRDHLIDAQHDKLSFVGSLKGQTNKQVIVQHICDALNITLDWHNEVADVSEAFNFFKKRLSEMGIVVMQNGIVGSNTHRKLDIDEFRAFTLIDDYAPLIFINSNDSKGGKLFSLIHEVIHIWLGLDNVYDDRYGDSGAVKQVEVVCNAVTADLLVPNKLFELEWKKNRSKETRELISFLAKKFRCGSIVIARKALNCEFISREEYRETVNNVIGRFNASRKDNGGGDYYVALASRIDARFLMALDNSVQEGKTQYTDAYRLTNTNRLTFSNLVNS
ncbi:MAG: ImmA/IrrE family metallo-endopeptidase [Candidatus Bathyarchaeota archaeon]|nr:ImmA/IrrE family metallo-endopeptidase [Candidatus Termitimicrobium sp.]